MAWLSVITVVKDDADGFARSLSSLLAQDSLDGVEFVVADSSADQSAIPSLLEGLPTGLAVSFEWSAPRGIYPAMNSALVRATGDYCYFLNAGDALFDSSVLRRVRAALSASSEWAFGPVEILEASGARVVTPPWDYSAEQAALFARGLFPPHQGTFASVGALRSVGGFDTSYRIAADYAAFLRLSLLGDPVLLPFVIASFVEGGTSTVNWKESFAEFHRARQSILRPSGVLAARERWETARHFGLVYAHREIRPRLSWRPSWIR